MDNSKFYEALELPKNATQDEIKKQYRDLAKKYHPDRKGGDAAKVHIHPLSSKRSLKLMRLCLILRRGVFTTNSEPRALREIIVTS